jgi:hypothetical protein
MRRSVLALLGLVSIATGCTGPGPVTRPGTAAARDIHWDTRRPLSWSDFRGPVDAAADGQQVAMTAASLRWNYEYALEHGENACEYWIQRVASEAVFNPDDSWARPGYLTDAILRHEQSHFDLTEIFRRELDARTVTLVGQRRDCAGSTLEQATRAAERGAAAAVQSIFDDVWADYVATQSLYDGRTQHGTLAAAQADWNRAISDALGSGRWQPPR